MSFRPLLFILSMFCTPLIGRSQTPNASDVIKDMVAYVKIPAPVNPACSYHVVNTSVSIADKSLSYAAASKLFTGTAIGVVAGSKVTYNTLGTNKIPLKMQEFTAGTVAPVERSAAVSFGWAGATSNVLGTVTLTLTKGQTKTYSIPSSMKVITIAVGNKYVLSGNLVDGPNVNIYFEKSAFSDCK